MRSRRAVASGMDDAERMALTGLARYALAGFQASRDGGNHLGECLKVDVVEAGEGHNAFGADSRSAKFASISGGEGRAIAFIVVVEAEVVLLQRDHENGPGDRCRRTLVGVPVLAVTDHGHGHGMRT